jgi:hypothetical protein
MTDYAAIKEFCSTPRQSEIIDSVISNGGIRPAAKVLGIAKSGVDGVVKLLKMRAANKLIAEHKYAIPEGFKIKGTTTLYKDGAEVLQWVKTTADIEKLTLFMEEASKAMSEVLPREAPVSPPERITEERLCNLYVLTDAHIGGLSWAKETGEDWDLKIAEETLCDCYRRLIDQSPPARQCLLAEIGDFLHFDSLEPITPTAHNILDSDGRFSKVVQTAIRVLRKIVAMTLEKHDQVTLIISSGNHDLSGGIWLRSMFSALLENEPRITVDNGEGPYYAHQFGNNMIAFAHGHLKKLDHLPLYFAAAFPNLWGSTTYRYAHTGHLHSVHEKEFSGITVMQHTTLKAKDAYEHGHGWLSNRGVTSITYHISHGQVARTTVTPEMCK